LFSLLEKGRVIGIEVDLKPQNRDAIRTGPLASSISLVDGSSVDANTLAAVRAQIRTGEKAMVVLDSNHTRDHVLAELRAYAPLVTTGSYIVVCDGHHAGSRWSTALLSRLELEQSKRGRF
jgi:cephalosporin hydroxylase